MKLVRPGGRLAAFSLPAAMEPATPVVVAKAAGARPCRINRAPRAAPTTPILSSHPKSEYLTGLIVELG